METKDIVILVACLALAGLSIYRRYAAKNKTGVSNNKSNTNTSMPSGKDDDYEPYSGK